jgi:hypothetical protein
MMEVLSETSLWWHINSDDTPMARKSADAIALVLHRSTLANNINYQV